MPDTSLYLYVYLYVCRPEDIFLSLKALDSMLDNYYPPHDDADEDDDVESFIQAVNTPRYSSYVTKVAATQSSSEMASRRAMDMIVRNAGKNRLLRRPNCKRAPPGDNDNYCNDYKGDYHQRLAKT